MNISSIFIKQKGINPNVKIKNYENTKTIIKTYLRYY